MLYQEYRPNKFEDMVGQEYTSTILKNQVSTGNIAHSYLFCGTRGTGKTSSSRIFAKAINCEHPQNGEPCGECDSCKAIEKSQSLDVIELDAASHNGVDDIREITAKMQYSPQSKYKIFIIDEAHMLSKSATNAFLKSLEEPPAHVVFILATTDPQQLPITIISRCQRFDFKRISVPKIIERLKYVCMEEKINLDSSILELIAKVSDGAMRDALSILEKIISIPENERNEKNIAQLLSVTGFDTISKLIESIIMKNTFEAIKILNELDGQGQDFNLFIKDIILYLRNLMILSSNGPEEIIAATKEDISVMKRLVALTDAENIISLLELVQNAEANLKWNGNSKIALETVAIKFKSSSSNTQNKEIIELKKMISNMLSRNINIDNQQHVLNQNQANGKNVNSENVVSNINSNLNPIAIAKEKTLKVIIENNKKNFAEALKNSKIYIQKNMLLFKAASLDEQKCLIKNTNNLKVAFSKYLNREMIIQIQ